MEKVGSDHKIALKRSILMFNACAAAELPQGSVMSLVIHNMAFTIKECGSMK
jgi:hypothetical protein